MPTYFQRPENALKRANEFYDVGKKERALDVLLDVLKSKKHRTWSKHHEQIMEKFVTLCVELKKSHIAKEGLYQYKIMCQQVNPRSFEYVVKFYLHLAEEKTENARNESHQMVVDSDDLDILETPEKMLMSAVSGEDSQDRSDRAILTPWLKFLWESYRQCLDLLRNNQNFEKLYQDVAQAAFKFCLKYSRKTEFRKLCENLRTHLGHIHKNQNQQRSINLNNPESQSLHLETRLAQLDSAIQIELWQEAFKAVEDIHSLINLSKKQPKPSLMANYYQKLALVLYKSGNALYHACAWHKLYHLYRDQRKNMTEGEMQKLASRVVIATLAIPLAKNLSDHIIDVEDTDKDKKLSNLLSYNVPPTRSLLIKDLVKYGIVQHVYPELCNLQNLLETEFQPLELPKKANTILEFLMTKDELAPYVQSLQDVTLTRFMKQISQVFQTISISHLQSMVPFADKFKLERIIVTAAKNLNLQVKINHKDNLLSFGTDFDMSREDVPEGPQLQSMPSEQIRNQLISMAKALERCVTAIYPETIQDARDALRHQILAAYKATFKKDHLHMLKRRQIIEDRKEEIENLSVQREREEQEVAEEQKRRQIEAEMARLSREAEEREKQRKLDEHRDIQKKVVRERLEQIKSTSLGAKAFADLSEETLATMDMDDILAKQVEQLEKEKKEKEEKLKAQEKKVDYFERAKCMEEIPFLLKKYEEDKVANKNYWEETEIERINEMKKERQLALAQKGRLQRIRADTEEFLAKLKEERMSIYKEKLKEFEKVLCEERKKRLLERKEKRKEDRMNAWLREREEEIQRKKDEELKKQKEEIERLAQAKKEQEDREYQEKKRKLELIEEKKRQKELEVEERERKRREESKPAWKEEPVKEDSWRRNGRDEKDIRAVREDRPFRDQREKGGFREEMERRGPREDRENWGPREERSIRDDRGPREERSLRDDRGPREDRDIRGPREERSFGARDWRTQRNEEPVQKEDSWRKDDAPRKTDAWRKESSDSWRSKGKDDMPARREDTWRKDDMPARREDTWRKNDTPARRDDAWRRDDGPVRRDDGPVRRDDGPVRRDDGPVRRDDGPVRRDDTWRRDEVPSRREEAWRKDDAPARRDDWRKDDTSARKEDSWRPQRNLPSIEKSEKKDEIKKVPKKEEDDGWQTVRH